MADVRGGQASRGRELPNDQEVYQEAKRKDNWRPVLQEIHGSTSFKKLACLVRVDIHCDGQEIAGLVIHMLHISV